MYLAYVSAGSPYVSISDMPLGYSLEKMGLVHETIDSIDSIQEPILSMTRLSSSDYVVRENFNFHETQYPRKIKILHNI